MIHVIGTDGGKWGWGSDVTPGDRRRPERRHSTIPGGIRLLRLRPTHAMTFHRDVSRPRLTRLLRQHIINPALLRPRLAPLHKQRAFVLEAARKNPAVLCDDADGFAVFIHHVHTERQRLVTQLRRTNQRRTTAHRLVLDHHHRTETRHGLLRSRFKFDVGGRALRIDVDGVHAIRRQVRHNGIAMAIDLDA